MYDDLSRPTAEPLVFDDEEQIKCRLSLLASALSGYPAFADELLAPFTPPVSVADISTQLERYTLLPEKQNGAEEPFDLSTASFSQKNPCVKSPPLVLLHPQSPIRRQLKSGNFFQMPPKVRSEEPSSDEARSSHPSLTSDPHDTQFLVIPDQPLICNSDPPAQHIEVDDTDPKTWKYWQIEVSGHERMHAPLEKPQRQKLVLKSIRYRKSAVGNKSHRQKRSAASGRALWAVALSACWRVLIWFR